MKKAIVHQPVGEKARQAALLRQHGQRILTRGGPVEVIEPAPLVDRLHRRYPIGLGAEWI
ncbi:hypothetical protein [Aestuariirhabdus litorea]|uniref:Uncharacterized protein n=1 Tax=Aestuariirhabdus litorea TaxID=2528527 RepID=A0A3P3VJ66_9GAMM|nr:hypothetical protein [Aestuariirhabdus litorea]RRJ82791.1 hypothetical protein D0544_13120 [Aestuariirhabdus litorea]RWW92950.1 hypothetical protein DZC74_13095 [Endozoicomonadaceae bacterium GTF-13]